MAEDLDLFEHRVRERAFQLWQEAGCPEGRDEEFWHQARAAVTAAAEKPEGDLVEEAGGHYPPTGDTQNFA
jgi:hypothetical protein